jgi:hypothetical protein
MELSKILTEDERARLGDDVVAKLESAYREEIAKVMKEESRKSNAKFESLMQVVGEKVDEKIDAAVNASIAKMKGDAINSKLYEAMEKITAIVEQAGIPATEVTKQLKQELAQADNKLQQAYVDRENIKKKLNYQAKLNRIYELTAGSSPDIVNAVIERFKNEDIRAIDKNAIADFIDNNDSGDGTTMNIDADVAYAGDGAAMPGIVDKVEMALNEIQDDMDMDMPGFLSSETEEQPVPRKRKALGEAARSTFKPERVRIPSTGSATVAPQLEPQSPDVADAMSQVEAFKGLGWGGRFC